MIVHELATAIDSRKRIAWAFGMFSVVVTRYYRNLPRRSSTLLRRGLPLGTTMTRGLQMEADKGWTSHGFQQPCC